MTTTVITSVSADDCDEWTDAVISNCFKSLNAAEDPARGSDSELALKQALTSFYTEYYTPRNIYNNVFTDFDYDIKPYIEKLGPGWSENSSYRNDACPRSDHTGGEYTVWFDYEDPNKSEYPEDRKSGEMKRFCVSNQDGTDTFSSDDFTDILNKVWELGL